MISAVTQRWTGGRASYRPAGEPIRTEQYEVAEIRADAPAKAYVLANHYSASYPAARFRFGLYRGARLAGVAVFSVPANDAAFNGLPGAGLERVELGRLVLDQDVPANGESWFIARCYEQLRTEGLVSVLMFSDPEPRRSIDGAVIFGGHIGTIYQATNATYLGRGTARTLRILPDGAVLSARALSKLRTGDQGWRYAAETLQRAGAAPLPSFEQRREWLAEQLPGVTRTQRHRGNHKYAWVLKPRDRRFLPASLPYPKFGACA